MDTRSILISILIIFCESFVKRSSEFSRANMVYAISVNLFFSFDFMVKKNKNTVVI